MRKLHGMTMVRWPGAMVLLGLAALCGCTEPVQSTRPDGGAPLGEAVRQGAVEAASAASGPVMLAPAVRWDEARGYRAIAADRLVPAQREVALKAPVPALVPDDDALLARAVLTHGESWFAASMRVDGHTIAVHGSARAVRVAGVSDAQKQPPPGVAYHSVTRTDGIVTLAFNAFGVAYAVDVECERPMDDVRCTQDAYVVELAESLGVVTAAGGQP